MKIRIGTRGSKLALWQAEYVQDLLQKSGLETEIVIIETKGDKVLNASFAEIGTKGLFTEELEVQLRNKAIDIAVHSAKDMQSQLPEDLEIIAFSEREQPFDVLISLDKNYSLDASGTKIIGTSSTRRRAILQHYYTDVEIKEARGNLQTRFRKLEEGQFEAMILAFAGVHRMHLDQYIVQKLPLNIFTPAVGQGSVAIETSRDLESAKREAIRKAINDPDTETCLLAERAFLNRLEGGCSIPAFGLAVSDCGKILMTGGVISLDGKEMIRETLEINPGSPSESGYALADKVLHSGGERILAEIRKVRK
jgi:hydroxymethylbilane synthase